MELHQNPAPQPDHVDQRMEHDGHVDPESLTPSTQDTGIQVQVYPRKRSKGVQVQPVKADAMNNTDGHMVGKMKKTESTSEDSVSTSESSDVDHDKSKDYVPLDSTSSSDDEENFKK
ncbi:uncharacterized protein LOC123519911 [Portunus trituberculatus]|uniref:uncharacterized protein LOC123519911 n=1 Tax=Portunus trituberculatus TaxID=210409 RepID=UPI001E1D08B1|nr:uncharacterized protein LOC123519911 [Portunus trituberculatus]